MDDLRAAVSNLAASNYNSARVSKNGLSLVVSGSPKNIEDVCPVCTYSFCFICGCRQRAVAVLVLNLGAFASKLESGENDVDTQG